MKNKGWHKESERHELAARGIPTKEIEKLQKRHTEDYLRLRAQFSNIQSELWKILEHPNYSVRKALLLNSNLPDDILIKLSKDKNERVRWAIIEYLRHYKYRYSNNGHTKTPDEFFKSGIPIKILDILSKDKVEYISDNAKYELKCVKESQ
jgi:hypothetical protein